MRDIVTKDTFFKSPRICWEDNRDNRYEFMKVRKCHKIDYHNEKGGCLPFDDALETIATEGYRTTLFMYYEIYHPSDAPSVPRYSTKRLAGTIGTKSQRGDEVLLLSRYAIIKKQEVLVSGELPVVFDSWPDSFLPKILAKTRRQKEMILRSIESCIRRRLEFRNKCVIPCSTVIKRQEVHDEFIVILQILRAKFIVDLSTRL